MNEKEAFIIEDLNGYHLIIKADEYRVRKELDAEVRTLSPLILEEVSVLRVVHSI